MQFAKRHQTCVLQILFVLQHIIMFIFQTLYSTFIFLLVFSGSIVFAFSDFAIPGQNMLSEIFGNKTEAEVYEESPSGRIINGAKVPDGKYNFVASLQALNIQNKWIHYCGGITLLLLSPPFYAFLIFVNFF